MAESKIRLTETSGFSREDVLRIVSAFLNVLQKLFEDDTYSSEIKSCGKSEERLQAVIDKYQKAAFVGLGFEEWRFGEIGRMYREFRNDEEVKKAIQLLCATEELFVNLVLSGAARPTGSVAVNAPPPSNLTMK